MTSPTTPSLKALLSHAHDLADQSGKVILPHFRKVLAVDDKSAGASFDPVTKADRAAERVISRSIKKRFPEHGIVGEEFGIDLPHARFRWVIDPIDGTRSFITGAPMWGTLIGLLEANSPILGLVDHPFTAERCWSGQDAAYARGPSGRARRIATRACTRIEDAFVMTTSPDLFEAGIETEKFLRVKARARMTRFGGDCYAYFLLASGLIDLIMEAGLKTYDVVALIPVIERAGGRITTWDGRPATDGGRIIAAGDPVLHERVLKLINR